MGRRYIAPYWATFQVRTITIQRRAKDGRHIHVQRKNGKGTGEGRHSNRRYKGSLRSPRVGLCIFSNRKGKAETQRFWEVNNNHLSIYFVSAILVTLIMHANSDTPIAQHHAV